MVTDISEKLVHCIRLTGHAIHALQDSPWSSSKLNDDHSPVTDAKRLSHHLLTSFLKEHSTYPVLDEESADIAHEERRNWSTFWLIDPLDGIQGFLNGNNQFTVNVALIRDGRPVLGIIYSPVKDVLYYGVAGKGAYKIEQNKTRRLPLYGYRKDAVVIGSPAHFAAQFDQFINNLRAPYRNITISKEGISFILCLAAEGAADMYPGLGCTMEWETAAGQVIVEEAGGSVLDTANHITLGYNKADLRNPSFIAASKYYREMSGKTDTPQRDAGYSHGDGPWLEEDPRLAVGK